MNSDIKLVIMLLTAVCNNYFYQFNLKIPEKDKPTWSIIVLRYLYIYFFILFHVENTFAADILQKF